MPFSSARRRVFCVGANKTGTTSMEELFKQLGLQVAPQQPAERMLEDWARRDFARLLEFCAGHQAFQDVPFSLPFTFQVVDQAFPGSKFILTVRRNADEWFESILRYETQFIGKGRLPVADDLKQEAYLSPGWLWRSHQLIWDIDEAGLYDPVRYKAQYERHNASIRDYFSQRPRDLLVLDLSEPAPVEKVCDFLGVPRLPIPMPHLNSSH